MIKSQDIHPLSFTPSLFIIVILCISLSLSLSSLLSTSLPVLHNQLLILDDLNHQEYYLKENTSIFALARKEMQHIARLYSTVSVYILKIKDNMYHSLSSRVLCTQCQCNYTNGNKLIRTHSKIISKVRYMKRI